MWVGPMLVSQGHIIKPREKLAESLELRAGSFYSERQADSSQLVFSQGFIISLILNGVSSLALIIYAR